MKNRVKELRRKLELSQRDLAVKVRVSQQHIHRVETNQEMEVGFDLALRLAKALGQPLSVVFPGTDRTLRRLQKQGDDSMAALFDDTAVQKDMEAAGIHMDVKNWFLRMKLRARVEMIDVGLADGEYSRLWKILQAQNTSIMPFVVFDGRNGLRYAVQQSHLLGWHFMFETLDLDSSEAANDEQVRVWFSDGTPPYLIGCEADEPTDFFDTGPLDYIFGMLEMLSEDERNSFSLVDTAGETFWFCANDVALFAAPVSLIAEPNEDDGEVNERP